MDSVRGERLLGMKLLFFVAFMLAYTHVRLWFELNKPDADQGGLICGTSAIIFAAMFWIAFKRAWARAGIDIRFWSPPNDQSKDINNVRLGLGISVALLALSTTSMWIVTSR